jgi:DNA-binding CsgD family transcriptional regulator
LILSRKQKEDLVIKLANEGKTTRDIAKEAHISLLDIGKIIRKHTGDDHDKQQLQVKKLTVESQAFRMFKEGRSNVDVAICLNLSATNVISLYQDFQEMSDLNKLNQLYRYLGYNLRYFIELYDRMKDEGLLTAKDILNVVTTQGQIRNLDRTIYDLYDEIGRLNILRMDLRDKISKLQNALNWNDESSSRDT